MTTIRDVATAGARPSPCPALPISRRKRQGGSWYPYSFLAPIAQNEPHLSHSLASVGALVDDLAAQGFGSERVALVGFSQGGSLGLEFAARNARHFGAVIGLSAGLIGDVAASAARMAARLGAEGDLRRGARSREGALGRLRYGRRLCLHHGAQGARAREARRVHRPQSREISAPSGGALWAPLSPVARKGKRPHRGAPRPAETELIGLLGILVGEQMPPLFRGLRRCHRLGIARAR